MDTNQAIQDLRGLVSLHGTEGDIVFGEPWQARAFALSERGIFSLRDFQVAPIGRINSYEKGQCIAGTGDYYTRWIEALEDLLVQKSCWRANGFRFLSTKWSRMRCHAKCINS
jgi:nitrile hydratase accessory protein